MKFTWILLKWVGVFTLVITSLIALLIALPLKEAPVSGKAADYALVGANLIDTRSGAILSNTTILIKNGTIQQVMQDDNNLPVTGYETLDVQGKYVIPGLWDMHTHSYKLSPQLHHPLYLAHGITGARDMSGCLDQDDSYWACTQDRLVWNTESARGERISPTYILHSSYQTNGGSEVPVGYSDFFRLRQREDADATAAFYARSGTDFIKVYTQLSPAQYAMLVSAAKRHKLTIAGHKPLKISLQEAIGAGQTSIEHGRLFLFECFNDIQAFRMSDNPVAQYNADLMWRMVHEQDSDTCNGLMDQMAASDTWWVPTLTTLRMGAYARVPEFRDDPRLSQIPELVKRIIWFPDADNAVAKGTASNGQYVREAFFAEALVQVGEAHKRGVKILVGTDVSDTYVFTGSGVHEELSMLVDAGLTPLEAIQAATIRAAEFSGLEHLYGSLEPGKAADLVILHANPLDDIKQSANIFAVMQHGIFYNREALDRLVTFVEQQAGSFRVNLRFLYDVFASPLMRTQFAD